MSVLARFPSVLMAWRNLGRNRVRTALAALGIVIGVISIASMGMASAAINQQASAQLGDLGNKVSVTSGEDAEEYGITQAQVERIDDLVSAGTVVEQKSDSTSLSSRADTVDVVTVTAVTEVAEPYNITSANPPETLHSGALLTNQTAETLGLGVGDPVKYDGSLYRIRGIITTTSRFGGFAELVVPLSAMADQDEYDTVDIYADSGSDAARIADRLDSEFNSYGRTEEKILEIRSTSDAREGVNNFMRTLKLGLLGIGSISLLVASVAILNVMLMSTIERRGEIGVLRAVGIRRGEVLRMILTEAMFLGAVGGLVGSLASLGVGAFIFDKITQNAMDVLVWPSSKYLVYGFLFAVFASLLSGLYPAWKAANDPPVEALGE
ncbi:ABC transporter permease [Halobacterium salinarum]|nr:ABC transporter permease [Halobacterium salinarum]MDL0143520.1 ABC transporter permease [Halobacterium salinarum]